jgi:phospholipase/lecithinase/hemolysin
MLERINRRVVEMGMVSLRLAGIFFLCLGILSIEAKPAEAAPVRYEAAFVFGDSISDPGNLFALSEAVTGIGRPGYPYYAGRSSNGPVWAEYLAADFAAAGLPFRNYAHGLARVVRPPVELEGLPLGLLPIHLDDQLLRFRVEALTGLPTRSVALVMIGSNDALGIISDTAAAIGAGADAEIATAHAIAAAQDVAARLLNKLALLAPAGIRDLVLFNLGDLGQTPRFAGTEAEALASLVTGGFNMGLASGTVEGLNVRPFDLAGLFDRLVLAPEDFGVSSLEPCFDPAVPSLCLDPETRAFFDPLHPSATIHARLANEVREVVAPVPLPAAAWLLLAALFGLSAVRLQGHRRTPHG